jgi:hypothetical protein
MATVPMIAAKIPTAGTDRITVGQTAALATGSSHTRGRCGTDGRPSRRFAPHLGHPDALCDEPAP